VRWTSASCVWSRVELTTRATDLEFLLREANPSPPRTYGKRSENNFTTTGPRKGPRTSGYG
jgi:hypothetical protein